MPPKGQRIYLSDKMNVGNGGDVTNVTSDVHPENIFLLERVHKLIKLPLTGIDFICEDVAIAWHAQSFALIENNSLPGVSQHHYPSAGAPVNAAGMIWNAVLESLL